MPTKKSPKKICSIDGCQRPFLARGFCRLHYDRWSRHGDPLHQILFYKDPISSFWSRVNKDGSTSYNGSSCWEWLGCTQGKGYGFIRGGSNSNSTHRFSWEIHFGEIPEGSHVLHHCDNPSCVNPDHLFLGTNQDNRNDCVSKNRQSKGENQYSARLTNEQVVEIRQRYKPYCRINGTHALGREFGVSHSSIRKVVHGVRWKHV